MRKLSELGEFAANAINMGTVAFITWYRDGRLLTANTQFFILTGYTEDEVKGMRWPVDFTTPASSDKITKAMDALDIGKKAYHHDEELIRKDKSKIPIEVYVHLYYPARSSEHYYYSFIADITQRKESEEALRRSKAQTELYINILIHDVNNMNQVGIGYLELALDTLRIEGKIIDKALLEKPLMALEYTTNIINNVRTLQKIQSAVMPNKPMDLCSVLTDVKRQFSRMPGRDITISYSPAPVCFVSANELLREVFLNLVGNAIKHSSPNKPLVVNINHEVVREDGRDYARVEVEDNGPGIPDDLKKGLFERFKTGKEGASAKGLGLYIVSILVSEYHGKVWAEDRIPGDYTKGARFVVLLPLAG